MSLSSKLLSILKDNPSWIGRTYEAFIIEAIKKFEHENPVAHSSRFNKFTNKRPDCYLHNPIFDIRSEENGEVDVSDVYVCYPDPIFNMCGITSDPNKEDKDLFCKTTWNGWGVEVKTKILPDGEDDVSELISLGELKTSLPLKQKSAWMQTIDGKEYVTSDIQRRWADFYIYILYRTTEGYPDFKGADKCSILVVPTIVLIDALSVKSSDAGTIQVNELTRIIGDDYLNYMVSSVDDIPEKILDLAAGNYLSMFKYKREGERLKRSWYEEKHASS